MSEIYPLIDEQLHAGLKVKISPQGMSMLPMLRQGIDSVELILPPAKLKKYDIVLYRRDTGNFVLHRIVKVNEAYTCVGDNQFNYEEGIYPHQILAVVSGFYRGEVYHDVNEPLYSLYCVLWQFTRGFRRLFFCAKRLCLRFI